MHSYSIFISINNFFFIRIFTGQLLLFYSIFYAVLAALFSICMQGLFATLNDGAPTRQLDDSRIGTNPGLGFRPISEDTKRGSLIWYDAKNSDQVNYWTNLLTSFLERNFFCVFIMY